MQILRPGPLHKQAYQILLTMLLEGEYQPGERLVETKLAEKLRVSRGTIREAIRMLIKDGLLTQSESAIYIYKPTLQDVIDLYKCREKLESLAAKLAAKNITKTLEKQINEVLVKSKKALVEEHPSKVVELNTQFHELIIRAARNKQLIGLLETIRTKSLYMRNNILRDYYMTSNRKNYIGEHEQIFKAIIEQDRIKAEEEMSKHIKNDLSAFYDFFEKKNVGECQCF
ncbi:GntR family transcriptional regulator [Peribacillus cavernae]|uniref:GntR family transcriptional regulator n=1 Tax=Peribacillus cavernae TaxID=1674310 RepID=A0A433H7C5_9BACI|nr:GntR family transcriptional regulator [Peribacillus cavernae]MDQ0221391.1 DNA-binding GntR family transcriptional regulator [Peribacillus cavernae]RUQ24220.1 GntR family transcriptional regulator [Peribacillus cavernae]